MGAKKRRRATPIIQRIANILNAKPLPRNWK
jgi:hypothetical protein